MYPQRAHNEDPIITFTGAYPPVGRVQEFAKALYHFITGTNPAGGIYEDDLIHRRLFVTCYHSVFVPLYTICCVE